MVQSETYGNDITLIQIDASVIVGVLILLSFTIGASPGSNETDIKLTVTGGQKSFHVNGFDVKPSTTTNEIDVRPSVTALTASAISAIFVALFSNETIVRRLLGGIPSESRRADCHNG